jgi:hypothetical protein
MLQLHKKLDLATWRLLGGLVERAMLPADCRQSLEFPFSSRDAETNSLAIYRKVEGKTA